MPSYWIWAFRIGAIVIGIVIGLSVLQTLITSGDSLFAALLQGTFGTTDTIQELIVLSTPLILTGAAAAFAFKIKLWNIGIEGQFFMGAWGAMAVALTLPHLPGPILIPLMCLVAAVMGALWILLPALARAYAGASEVITTLLLNLVAGLWITYWVAGRWRDPLFAGAQASLPIPEQARMPIWSVGGFPVYSGLLVAIAAAILLWALLRFTTFGYQVRIAGASDRAGAYAGLPIKRLQVMVMLMSGAVGGLVGEVEMAANVHRLSTTLSNNVGYTGIVVAVIAGSSLIAVIFIGAVMGWVASAGSTLTVAGVNPDSLFALTGFIVVLAACGERLARYRLRRAPSINQPVPPDGPPGVPGKGRGRE
jgi:simple sugar transport system permease protein